MKDYELRDQVAQATLQRIRGDLERVSPRVRSLLETIQKRLFDPDFNVTALWRENTIRDRNASTWFAQEAGSTPWTYVTDCRLEVAARLLLETALKPWQIASSVGYSGASTFRKAFKGWSGQTPTSYRLNPRSLPAEAAPSAPPLGAADQALAVGAADVALDLLAEADNLSDRDVEARLGLAYHCRGSSRTLDGDVDRAFDDLSRARRHYRVAGELPRHVVRSRRRVLVSHLTDEALAAELCPECRKTLASEAGRPLRQHLRKALLPVPRDLDWFTRSCDACFLVVWDAISRARLGLMTDVWRAWWLSENADVFDPDTPPSRGRIVAALAESQQASQGEGLKLCQLALADARAVGNSLLLAQTRLFLSNVLRAAGQLAQARAQLEAAGVPPKAGAWLTAFREWTQGVLEIAALDHARAPIHLQGAYDLYLDVDPHFAGLVVMDRWQVHFHQADAERSIEACEEARALLDERRDQLAVETTLPIYLAMSFGLAERWEEAEAALASCRYDPEAQNSFATAEVYRRAGQILGERRLRRCLSSASSPVTPPRLRSRSFAARIVPANSSEPAAKTRT